MFFRSHLALVQRFEGPDKGQRNRKYNPESMDNLDNLVRGVEGMNEAKEVKEGKGVYKKE